MLGLANKPTSVFKSLSLPRPMRQGGRDVLGAPGDVYIITDTRKNPRKDLSKMSTFQKFDTRKLNVENLQKMSEDDPLLYEEIKSGLGVPSYKKYQKVYFPDSDNYAEIVDKSDILSWYADYKANRKSGYNVADESFIFIYKDGSYKFVYGNDDELAKTTTNLIYASNANTEGEYVWFDISKPEYLKSIQKITGAEFIPLESLFGLGKLGDKYVITDLREKPKKDLTDIKNISRAKINIEPYSAENPETESVSESVTASNVAMTDGGVKIQVDGNKFVVTSPYSTEFVKVARNYGGKWNGDGWVFANSEMPDIKKKLLEIYGSDGTLQPAVTLLVKNLSDRSDVNSGYELFNIPIARAYGRDSGARLNSNIILIDGEITSDGSMKHPYTRLKEATFRIKDVPKSLINNNIYLANAIKDGWVKVVENEGLGKPTIKFEFEDNADLFNFFATKNDYSNAQNVDFENVATSTASNGKRGASRTQRAITTPETLYLPYSEGSKALPGSANPKSLPPASQNIPQPSSPKALPPSGLENDETFIPFGYEKITDEKVIQRFNESRNILNNSGLIPVSDIISVIEKKPSVIFTAAGTDGIKKYKFKGKEDGEFIFEAVNDNGEPIPGEVNLRFFYNGIERLNALKSWFINPESTSKATSPTSKDWENAAILKSLLDPITQERTAPDWAAIYKRLVDSHQWNSFEPESAAEYDVKIFRNAYNNVIAELPENRKADFTQEFIAKVYEIARLNAAAPSAAVTGRGGITAKKAAKYNAANDRYMQARADFSEWLDNYAERAAKIEERERKAAMNVEERRDERFEVIKKDIDYFSALLKNRAQVPSYRISNARQNLQSKLETEAYKGNVETITKLLEYMRPLNVFTNRSSVWQLADLAQRRRAKYQEAEKAFEEQNADENADYKIEFDENEDRVKIYFNGIPSENIRTWLKQHNFRWSPRNKAWQRQITVDSRYVVNKFNSMMKSGELSGLGKPTVKFEFEDNAEIFKTFGSGVSGLTVNDKPAALFNCPESLLQCKGFTPSYRRLEDYSALIEPAKGEKKLVGYGFEVATLNELANACNHYNDVARLASHLKADNVLQSAFNVWHWLHTNIKYNYDTPGEEEIRTPARSWADRENGVDCDCIAVFTACLLGAMGYKPQFEIVAFNNSPKYSHIYVNLDGAAIDRVLPVFLARPENITKTKIMDIPVFELSGTAEGGFSTLNGIYADTLLKVNSGTANAQDSMDLRKTQVLLGLQKSDPQAYKLAAILMPYVVAIDDNGSYYFANDKVAEIAENADKKLYSLKISGANQAAFDDFFNGIVGEMKNISVRLERGNGKTIVTISFTNPQNDTYNVEGEYVKKDMLAINPDFLTMRNALKNLIAVNYYDLATRFAVGLMTEVNAVQVGYTPETWQKAVEATNKLKKLWTLLGGDVETLNQVIESGAEKEAVVDIDGDTSIIETSAFDSVLHGCKYNALSGINGLGETSTVNSELDTLGEGFETLLEWVAEIEPGETVNISIQKTSDGESNIRYASTMQDSESNNKAWLWLLGGAVVGGGIAAATSGKKNKKSKR